MADAGLRAQPFWTPADQAELELVTLELVRALWLHHERCPKCRGDVLYNGCDRTREAIEVALEWREGRILRSKAAYLRAIQAELEEAALRRERGGEEPSPRATAA